LKVRNDFSHPAALIASPELYIDCNWASVCKKIERIAYTSTKSMRN
jgi:hypothetical protein